MAAGPAESGVAQPTRAAILVIHGIGEQSPFQALDAFTRGLAQHFGDQVSQLEHRLVWRAGRPDTALRLSLSQRQARARGETADASDTVRSVIVVEAS